MKHFGHLSATLVAATLTFGTAQVAHAAGDETPPTAQKCKKGLVLDKQSGKCVKAESSLIDSDERYDALRQYAYARDYAGAELILASFADQQDPRVLNYKGFIARKQGQMDDAMMHYEAALRINPDYILARSYMGQGLADMGDLDGARLQLAEIRDRGGRNTWSYTALSLALRGVQTNY